MGKKTKNNSQKLGNLKNNSYIVSVFKELSENYKISQFVLIRLERKEGCAVLSKLGVMEFMDFIVSNEDVKNSKPHPEM